MNKQSITYYGGRVFQRLAVCAVVGATIIHWIILISITTSTSFVTNLADNKFKDSQMLNDTIAHVIDTQSLIVLKWFIVATVITALLVFMKRYRKYDKSMLVDSAVILVFCMLSVVLAQVILRAYISRL